MTTDSSSVGAGINNLNNLVGLKDTVIYNNTVYKYTKENIYLAYGKDWLLVYYGEDFKRTYHDILFAKLNEIPSKWRSFLNKDYSSNSTIAQISTKNLENIGIETILCTLSNDSTSLTLNAQINQFDTLSFQLKQSNWEYSSQEFTRNMTNLNLDIERLRNNPEDPIVLFLKNQGAKINFPINDLLNAWEGDLAFRQGGIQKIREKYIESELDDNFNVTEIIKYRNVKVPGFSGYLSMNQLGQPFVKNLLDKGILTRNENKYRLLFSSPFIMNQTDSTLVFHTGKFEPLLYSSDQNKVLFTHLKMPYRVYLDSTSLKTVYGRIQIPLDKFVKDNLNL
jgi:hypothetical protein